MQRKVVARTKRMTTQSSSHNEIAMDKGHSLKHLTHWPPVNIKFEDIIYTVDSAVDSECKFLIIYIVLNINFRTGSQIDESQLSYFQHLPVVATLKHKSK